MNLEKTVLSGTYRSIGQIMAGVNPMDIPIAGSTIRAISSYVGGTAYMIEGVKQRDAFIIARQPLRLLYVRAAYTKYREVAKRVFPETRWPIDFDHILGRKMAKDLGFQYVLLIRLPPKINRGHGPFEKARELEGLNLQKLCFLNERILDKWLGRTPRLFVRKDCQCTDTCECEDRLAPYKIETGKKFSLTLKQAGKFGFALGVEENLQPLVDLIQISPR